MNSAGFSAQVVRWQKLHGRHSLPWQDTRDPYRVWLSEVMLQQTQVATVVGYYQRFLARFADVRALAGASLDEVMALWSGLGYYSRARNLHRCAMAVVQRHGGEFPQSAAELQRLPGIGASTAAAIASLCFGQREAILDANVRRVLTRYLGFRGDLAQAAQQRELLLQAQALLPRRNLVQTMPPYTQGLMDLGATICTARSPDCPGCPLASRCVARNEGNAQHYPVRTRLLRRGSESVWMLWLQAPDQSLWLGRRPAPGVWAALYCFPLFANEAALRASVPARLQQRLEHLPVVKHALTHKELLLHPVRLHAPASFRLADDGAWLGAAQWPGLGLPAPVRRLLQLGGSQPKDVDG